MHHLRNIFFYRARNEDGIFGPYTRLTVKTPLDKPNLDNHKTPTAFALNPSSIKVNVNLQTMFPQDHLSIKFFELIMDNTTIKEQRIEQNEPFTAFSYTLGKDQ